MTRSKLILLALLFAVSARADEFADAARLYDAGKFTEARNAYDALVHDGKYGANLFYDLGNTWFRLDEPGRAILNYERALALEPSHPEARANLAFVREKTGAQIPPRTWLDYLAAPFNINIFAVGAAIAAWIVVFAILGLRMSRRPSPLLWFVLAAAVFVLGAEGRASPSSSATNPSPSSPTNRSRRAWNPWTTRRRREPSPRAAK